MAANMQHVAAVTRSSLSVRATAAYRGWHGMHVAWQRSMQRCMLLLAASVGVRATAAAWLALGGPVIVGEAEADDLGGFSP